jgi:hypothetical protein
MNPVQKQTVGLAVADIAATAAAVHGRTTAGKQAVRMKSGEGVAFARPFHNASAEKYPDHFSIDSSESMNALGASDF